MIYQTKIKGMILAFLLLYAFSLEKDGSYTVDEEMEPRAYQFFLSIKFLLKHKFVFHCIEKKTRTKLDLGKSIHGYLTVCF